MLEAARAVRPLVLARFRSAELAVAERGGEGPVTEVDVAVHHELRRVLAQHYPDYGFAGEEPEPTTPATYDRRWLVDALDGTRNFIAGNRNFAVSISCQRRDGEGWRTTDAVIMLPAQGEMYWAERGQGAYHIAWDGRETRLRVPPARAGLRDALVDLSIKGLGDAVPALHARLAAEGAVPRATGCAALMLAMVSGTGNTGAVVTANDYDVAAGLLVAEEAGARWSARTLVRDGRTFTAYIAAEAPVIHDALRAVVEGVLPDRG
jgi:myo-inositol-1(or 4)-monophosphatase